MRGKLFWWMFFLMHHTSRQSLTLEDVEEADPVTRSVSLVADILGNLKLAVWFTEESRDSAAGVAKGAGVPVVLNAAERPTAAGTDTRTPSDLVLVLKNASVARVLEETLWNGDTRFLLTAEGEAAAAAAFETFWTFKVINAFALVPDGEDVLVYGFLPYGKATCAVGDPLLVDRYVTRTGRFLGDGAAFRDSARIKDMNGCPVNITVVDLKPNVIFIEEKSGNASGRVEGIEGNLMNVVAKRLNFSATYAPAPDGLGWGWIHPSPHGAVGEVFRGGSDFAIGLLAPTVERFENLDISVPYNGDECITYGVPTGAGASTPNWITILVFEFSPAMWALIVASSVLAFVVFGLVNGSSGAKWFPGRMDVALFMMSSCMGLPVKAHDHLSLRLALLSWIIFSFVVTVAYRSSMGSKLTVPNKDPDIDTFNELLESDLEFTGYRNMKRLLEYNNIDSVTQKMLNRFKVTDFDIDHAVDLIASERKIAYIRHTTTFLYYALTSPKAKGHVHVIKDCIILYYPAIVTKKHSAFTNRLNQLISRLLESGITRKWRSNYIYDVLPATKPFLKLSNDHLYGVFCILCVGHLLGGLAFLVEIVHYYALKKRTSAKLFRDKRRVEGRRRGES